MANIDRVLRDIYYNAANAGSFGGQQALLREAQKQLPNIKPNQVGDWLAGQLVYTLHKPLRKRFQRNKIIASKPLENFQIDLVDMRLFSRQNDGYNYILTVIDVFSKKAWAVPIKTKTAVSVVKALEPILKDNTPDKVQSDE